MLWDVNFRKEFLKNAGNKNTVIEMKNAFDGFIDTLDMLKQKMNEVEDVNRNFSNWKEPGKKEFFK